MKSFRRVLVIGLDGLDPGILAPLLQSGQVPHLAQLARDGGFAPVATTYPAQTPVAWSTFATGTNPGGHGIFDFVRRDPRTYLPDFALNRYEQRNPFVPARAVNLRRGRTVWEHLSDAGVAAVVLRCPCTFPPESIRGRVLAGMGVPDLRGGLGTSTFYTAADGVDAGESENVVRLPAERHGELRTHVIGPRNPRDGSDFTAEIRLRREAAGGRLSLLSDGTPPAIELRESAWSEWLRLRFRTGPLQSVTGMLRFRLLRLEPLLELYASPVNFDPTAPPFPISSPAGYARELDRAVGTFYTAGMVEDHNGLSNGRLDEAAYLEQCGLVLDEREHMLQHELDRFDEGLLFCLFDTPDRLQHMFWRFREPGHPANRGDECPDLARVIEDHCRACDAIVGRALERTDERTLVIVLSDHGFGSFQRGVHLNAWLRAQGLLALRRGVAPGDEAGDMLRAVDWDATRAYAVGLSGIYLNVRGREASGQVAPEDAPGLAEEIAVALAGLPDPARGAVAVRRVLRREEVYAGPYLQEAPDLLVNYAAGYRTSWSTALGGVPAELVEDNRRKWGGDHIVDPELVPGVLFANRPFRTDGPRLLDLAPTILAALGVPVAPAMEGASLLA